MSSDKKRKGNQLNFVLLNSIGSAEICNNIEITDILDSIKLT
jgi:3-dehydroquinate synthetase